MTRTIAILITLLLSGCISGHLIKESGRSLDDIKVAIRSVSGDPRLVSENKREYTSQYFSRKKDPAFDPTRSKERLYAKFTILGERRPYDIQVQVMSEERSDGAYEDNGLDDDFTEKIALELKRELVKRSGERNVIDNFRAF